MEFIWSIKYLVSNSRNGNIYCNFSSNSRNGNICSTFLAMVIYALTFIFLTGLQLPPVHCNMEVNYKDSRYNKNPITTFINFYVKPIKTEINFYIPTRAHFYTRHLLLSRGNNSIPLLELGVAHWLGAIIRLSVTS